MFKNFLEFLNEWRLTKHWSEERVSLNSPESRIAPFSESQPYGWVCNRLIKITNEGKNTKDHLSTGKFLEMAGMTSEDFKVKISIALRIYLTSKKIINANYPIDTHRAVDLKKLAFREGQDYWSPEFTTKDDRGRTHVSNQITAMVKDNEGVTIMFRDPYNEDIYNSANIDRIRGDKSTMGMRRTERFSEYSKEDYIRSFFSVTNIYDKDFFLVIPSDEDWERIVKSQAETGNKWKPINIITKSPEETAWASLLKTDLQAIFDSGSKFVRFVPDPQDPSKRTGKVRFVSNADITDKTMSFLPVDDTGKPVSSWIRVGPDSTIDIVAAKESNERALGDLPAEGSLVKRFKVDRAFSVKDEKGKTKIAIKGTLVKIYVLLPNGQQVFSPYENTSRREML